MKRFLWALLSTIGLASALLGGFFLYMHCYVLWEYYAVPPADALVQDFWPVMARITLGLTVFTIICLVIDHVNIQRRQDSDSAL